MTITNEDLLKKFERLEELQLQLSVFNQYISDKNNYDMNAMLTMLFTLPKNIEIVRANLVDPADLVVLDRLVAKWQQTVVVNEDKPAYNH